MKKGRTVVYDDIIKKVNDLEEVKDFYLHNSKLKTAKHFGLRQCELEVLIDTLNWNANRDSHLIRGIAASKSMPKKKATKLLKYGDENYNNRDQAAETNLERYGRAWYVQTDEFRQQYETTCLEKYGCKNTFQLTNWQELYGVDNPSQIDWVADKMRNTWRNKDEEELAEIDAKRRDTCQEKYGKEYYLLTDEFKQQSLDTLLSKYNVENISQVDWVKKQKVETRINNGYSFGGTKHLGRFAYCCDGERFDSSWELALWIYAKDHNEEIVHGDAVPIFYYNYNGKIHRYFPDFIYKGDIIEIKADWSFNSEGILINPYSDDSEEQERAKAKFQCMLDNNVKILTKKDLQFVFDYIKYKNSLSQ